MKILGCLFQLVFLAASLALGLNPAKSAPPTTTSAAPADADPWSASQTISPADFVKELQAKRDPALKIVYVGVRTLYSGAHIPGATFHGPGSSDHGR